MITPMMSKMMDQPSQAQWKPSSSEACNVQPAYAHVHCAFCTIPVVSMYDVHRNSLEMFNELMSIVFAVCSNDFDVNKLDLKALI